MECDRWKDNSGGLLFEELGESSFGVLSDDEPFLFGTALAFSPRFLLGFLGHLSLVSHSFSVSVGEEMVPQPGIEPGRRIRARGCKPRSSASSDTGGNPRPDVGAVESLPGSAAPTLFEPSSAALYPSSQGSSYAQDKFCGEPTRSYHSRIRQAISLPAMFSKGDDVSFPRYPIKYAVNSVERIAASSSQPLDYLSASDTFILTKDFLAIHDDQDSIRNLVRPCGKRNSAPIYTRDLRERSIHGKSRFFGKLKHLVGIVRFINRWNRWRRWGWGLRRGADCRNHFLERLKLFANGFSRTASLEFMWTDLDLKTVSVFHSSLQQLNACIV